MSTQPTPAVTREPKRHSKTLSEQWDEVKRDPKAAAFLAARIEYELTLNGEDGAAAKRLMARMSGEHKPAAE